MVLEGEVEFDIAGRVIRPTPGEEVLIPAGTLHTVRNSAAPRLGGCMATKAPPADWLLVPFFPTLRRFGVLPPHRRIDSRDLFPHFFTTPRHLLQFDTAGKQAICNAQRVKRTWLKFPRLRGRNSTCVPANTDCGWMWER